MCFMIDQLRYGTEMVGIKLMLAPLVIQGECYRQCIWYRVRDLNNDLPFVGIDSQQEFLAVVSSLASHEVFMLGHKPAPLLVMVSEERQFDNFAGKSNIEPNVNIFNGIGNQRQFRDFSQMKESLCSRRDYGIMMHLNCRSVKHKID